MRDQVIGQGGIEIVGDPDLARAKPRGRFAFGSSATRRATGTPERAMVTASPAATRCRRREKWVLASWMFTSMKPTLD